MIDPSKLDALYLAPEHAPPSDYELVHSFHEAFGATIAAPATAELIRNRWALIAEEITELASALFELSDHEADCLNGDLLNYGSTPRSEIDPQDVAKEAADVLYTVHGLGVNTGIDTSEAFRMVHHSNMTKLWPDGKPRYRASDGKVLKPPGFAPPDMIGALQDFPTERTVDGQEAEAPTRPE